MLIVWKRQFHCFNDDGEGAGKMFEFEAMELTKIYKRIYWLSKHAVKTLADTNITKKWQYLI